MTCTRERPTSPPAWSTLAWASRSVGGKCEWHRRGANTSLPPSLWYWRRRGGVESPSTGRNAVVISHPPKRGKINKVAVQRVALRSLSRLHVAWAVLYFVTMLIGCGSGLVLRCCVQFCLSRGARIAGVRRDSPGAAGGRKWALRGREERQSRGCGRAEVGAYPAAVVHGSAHFGAHCQRRGRGERGRARGANRSTANIYKMSLVWPSSWTLPRSNLTKRPVERECQRKMQHPRGFRDPPVLSRPPKRTRQTRAADNCLRGGCRRHQPANELA